MDIKSELVSKCISQPPHALTPDCTHFTAAKPVVQARLLGTYTTSRLKTPISSFVRSIQSHTNNAVEIKEMTEVPIERCSYKGDQNIFQRCKTKCNSFFLLKYPASLGYIVL